MKKGWNYLLFALLSAVIAGCGREADNISVEGSFCLISEEGAALDNQRVVALNLEDFWEIEVNDDNTVKFVTGLEMILPDEWRGNIVYETESDNSGFNNLLVCEKGNADAGLGGDLFYLCLIEHAQGTIVLYDWDKVLGLYRQGGREYVLVQDQPGDRCYSEEDQALIDAYQTLSGTMDNVIIKTDNMGGFTECGIEDLDWVQYESAWEDKEQSADDPAENQNDMETVFVNRHGDVFNGEGDTVGIMATLRAFEWLVPRSSGECIAENVSAEENEFITESSKVLNGSEEAGDRVWIRIVQDSVPQGEGSAISHKDFLFYVVGEDAYAGIQSSADNDLWTIWKMPDYGDWLEKEINIYIRMTTGL